MILPDHEIVTLAKQGMISPFVDHQVRELDGKKVISYGVSSYGYDMRLGNQFKIFNARAGYSTYGDLLTSSFVDPKNFDTSNVIDFEGSECIIPPHSYALGVSVEKWDMPNNVTGICLGKSTYARCAVLINVTPLEAGWSGFLTIEISNLTALPVKVYANEGIAQALFLYNTSKCKVSYADRAGKYQNQGPQVILPKV